MRRSELQDSAKRAFRLKTLREPSLRRPRAKAAALSHEGATNFAALEQSFVAQCVVKTVAIFVGPAASIVDDGLTEAASSCGTVAGFLPVR